MEFWLQGPVPGVPDALMPAAHALLQSQQELHGALEDFPAALLWERPGGAASVGFHLRHIAGSTARLLAYARGEQLTAAQLDAARREADPGGAPESAASLLASTDAAIEAGLGALRAARVDELYDRREVGRARVPSTLHGVLSHVAEHTRRHCGQVVATARILRGLNP